MRLRRLSFTELMHAGSVRCGQNTERQCRGREGLASYSIEFSVYVCQCHQDLLDAVDVNVLMKNLVEDQLLE